MLRVPIIAFAAGVLALQQLPSLPGTKALALAAILALFVFPPLWAVLRGRGRLRQGCLILLAFLCGFSWAAWRAELRLAEALAPQDEARNLWVVGVVDGLPQRFEEGGWRFALQVEQAEVPVPQRIQLSWYQPWKEGAEAPPSRLRPGERWHLLVRLKRPHGLINPGGFDYERWLLERGLRATGYVRHEGDNQRLAAFVPSFMNRVHRQRERVREDFLRVLGERPYAGVQIALAVGDQRAIPQEQWEVFRRTAIAHLVAISGMHVSIFALFVGGLSGWAWRRIPWLTLRVPARRVAALLGLLAAAAYALLAGFEVPAQRTLYMLGVGALAIVAGRETAASHVLAVALLVVLLLDPWTVMSAGFWLSFGAVATIFWVLCGRAERLNAWQSAVRIQLAITLALTPLLLALFGAFSLVGPLANAFAIPLVSFVITPLVLVAIVFPSPLLLWPAEWLTGLMMHALEWLSALPFALWHGLAAPWPVLLAAVCGVMWLLLPRATPGRLAALLALLPLLLWTPARPEPGTLRAVVLDVGQGLAVHVQTARHDLLYDAGPQFGPATDAGERVVLPYLRARGVRHLDAAVFSHADSDHVGGAPAVLAALPVRRLWSGLGEERERIAASAVEPEACELGRSWEWDGVSFRFLHPGPEPRPVRRNDASCVLQLRSPHGSLLLPGDIGAGVEQLLVRQLGEDLRSTVVVAPHHGSRNSSSLAFVAASAAEHVVHSAGRLNPYRHPHPDAWQRWAEAQARNWRTDAHGAVHITIGPDGVVVESWRERAPRYWHGR